ncbi:MAG: mannonate dehydratase [Candidatus Marinimicrobia bacterium]|nr:mannonate dehydratase [Candidatus Neomarinimicrobiota bacterium]MCF7880619.1 mannonate dehydratase [Candidatus Neomarinimicrobiota bacterium]
MEYTWRWFGPDDPVTLEQIKPTGATGIVTSLGNIPRGEVWPIDSIMARKQIVEKAGFSWSVAESIPIHEDIKKRIGDYQDYIDNFKQTIRNLGQCGIDTVCYNFMPVSDWARTDLNFELPDGSVTTRFEIIAFAAFDLYILQRLNAEKSYSNKLIERAENYYNNLTAREIEQLTQTMLLPFPATGESLTLKQFRDALEEYRDIDEQTFRNNLYSFLQEIIPAAEEAGVRMGIHPDDPPRPLFGLPRVVSTKKDIQRVLDAIDSPSNGLTLGVGSLASSSRNDIIDITKSFAHKVHFTHLRNVKKDTDDDFTEVGHIGGDADMYTIIKILIQEQDRRLKVGREDIRMPVRPDHGPLMLDDIPKKNIYPGYSLYGRLRGLAELRGLELGIRRSMDM